MIRAGGSQLGNMNIRGCVGILLFLPKLKVCRNFNEKKGKDPKLESRWENLVEKEIPGDRGDLFILLK